MFLRVLSALLVHINFVFHMSALYSALRGFSSAGPTIWNSLPLSVTSCSTIHTFKKQLKTHLFASAFPSSWIVLDAPLIRWSPFMYLFGCPWFCACLNVCYYYYYYYYYKQINTSESDDYYVVCRWSRLMLMNTWHADDWGICRWYRYM